MKRSLCISRKRVSSSVQCKRQNVNSFSALMLRKAYIIHVMHILFCSCSQHRDVVEDRASSTQPHMPTPAKLTWFQVSLQPPKHKYVSNSVGEVEPSFWQGCIWDWNKGRKNPQRFWPKPKISPFKLGSSHRLLFCLKTQGSNILLWEGVGFSKPCKTPSSCWTSRPMCARTDRASPVQRGGNYSFQCSGNPKMTGAHS